MSTQLAELETPTHGPLAARQARAPGPAAIELPAPGDHAAHRERAGFRWIALAVVLLAWLAAYAWRPWILGFYADDWSVLLLPARETAAFSAARLGYYLELYANRPLLGLITFVLSSVCGTSASAWHTAAAFLSLASALALWTFLVEFLRGSGGAPGYASAGAALWLLLPWTLGTTAWPTEGPTMLAVLFFALCGRSLLKSWRICGLSASAGHSAAAALPAAIWFLAGCLAYEAFYLQFVVLVILACGWPRSWTSLRNAFITAGVLGAAQGLAIAWNRLAPLFAALAPSKGFRADWPALAVHNLLQLPSLGRFAAPEFTPFLELVLVSPLVVLLIQRLRRLARGAGFGALWRDFWLLLRCALGLAMACTVLALAGYQLGARGGDSRTTLAVSFWIAVAWTWCLAQTAPTAPPGKDGPTLPIEASATTKRGWPVAPAAAAFVLLGTVSNFRLHDWSRAWQMQLDILEAAPVTDLANAGTGAAIVFVGPYSIAGVHLFANPWDLDGAMRYTHPALPRLAWLPTRPDVRTTWDGQILEQRKRTSGSLVRRTAAREVWLWSATTGRATRQPPPFAFPAVDPAPSH